MIWVARVLVRAINRVLGVQGHAEALRRWCARRYPLDLRIDDFDGVSSFWCQLDDYVGSHVFWRGAHSVDELAFLSSFLARDMVVLDVGAHQGEISIFCAKRVPEGRVIAVEPMSAHFARLTRNVEANDLDNVDLRRVALGFTAQELEIYVAPGRFLDGTRNEGMATLYPDSDRSQRVERVPVRTLDEMAAEWRLDRLDVIKIDVEGSELDVLNGGSRIIERFRPVLLIEVDDTNLARAGHSSSSILDWVEVRGFKAFNLSRDGALSSFSRAKGQSTRNIVCRPDVTRNGLG
jgi:FkbM family methyltransferase